MKPSRKIFLNNFPSSNKNYVNIMKESLTICCVVRVKWCILQEWLNILWQLKVFIFIRLRFCCLQWIMNLIMSNVNVKSLRPNVDISIFPTCLYLELGESVVYACTTTGNKVNTVDLDICISVILFNM